MSTSGSEMPTPQDALQAPPPGFRRVRDFCAYASVNGPLYGRIEGAGRFSLACRLTPDHANMAGICHGGWLLSLADMAIGFACTTGSEENGRKFLPTVTLSADFLAPARAGQWLQADAALLQNGRRIAFAECLVSADGEPVLRASGTFKVPSADNAPFAIEDFLLPPSPAGA